MTCSTRRSASSSRQHKAQGDLNLTPLKFSPRWSVPRTARCCSPARSSPTRPASGCSSPTPVITGSSRPTWMGHEPVAIGSGEEGFDDGGYEKATFNRPQGMCLDGDTLYVADTENHAIRAVDLKERNGQPRSRASAPRHRRSAPGRLPGRPRRPPLCSPWDVIQLPGDKAALYRHGRPAPDLEARPRLGDASACSPGRDMRTSWTARPESASFAQPSGLATDGENLFVADSEVSGVRVITGIRGQGSRSCGPIVGQGLFEFGDQDGRGATVRLQHCLGLAYGGGHLYIADTYNNKIKVCDPKNRSVHALVGSHKPGDSDDPPHFYEPGGLSVAGIDLYVADTNNHKIRVVDLKTHAVKTLALEGLRPSPGCRGHRVFPNKPRSIDVPAAEAAPGKSIKLDVSIPLPKGFKLNEEVPLTYLVETPDKTRRPRPEVPPRGQKIKPPAPHSSRSTCRWPRPPPRATSSTCASRSRRSSAAKTSSLCQIKSYVWNVADYLCSDDRS